MNFKYTFVILFSLLFLSVSLSKKVQKKINKAIVETYNTETYSLKPIIISNEIKAKLVREIKDETLYKILNNNQLIGYAYIDKAPSKTATYDFLVLFDSNLIVAKSKVLIYREEYGGEIGSKRWLKQFIGAKSKNTFKVHDNIIAISGATISVNSMTHAMNQVLQNINTLQELNIL